MLKELKKVMFCYWYILRTLKETNNIFLSNDKHLVWSSYTLLTKMHFKNRIQLVQ